MNYLAGHVKNTSKTRQEHVKNTSKTRPDLGRAREQWYTVTTSERAQGGRARCRSRIALMLKIAPPPSPPVESFVVVKVVLRISFCAHRSLFERDSGGRGRGALSLIVKLLHADNHALIRSKLLAIRLLLAMIQLGGRGGEP